MAPGYAPGAMTFSGGSTRPFPGPDGGSDAGSAAAAARIVATAVGVVPTQGRSDLPRAMLSGRSLVSLAIAALEQARVAVLPTETPWSTVQDRRAPVVLHDPLCPLLPAELIAEAVDLAGTGAVIVGCRPVTDTIKSVTNGRVGRTVDREQLLAIASPIVLPTHVVAELSDWPDTSDYAGLVTTLRDRFPITFLEVPAVARRVEDESAVLLLEASVQLAPRPAEDD